MATKTTKIESVEVTTEEGEITTYEVENIVQREAPTYTQIIIPKAGFTVDELEV